MQLIAVTQLQEIQDAARDVARNLPEAHRLTRSWREGWFQQAAERFVELVYQTSVDDATEEVFARLTNAVEIATRALEIHLLSQESKDYPAHRTLYNIIERLRIAHQGLSRGYSPDPAKRPTTEEIRQKAFRTVQQLWSNDKALCR